MVRVSVGTESMLVVPSEVQNQFLSNDTDLEGHVTSPSTAFPNKVHYYNDSVAEFDLINATRDNTDRDLNQGNENNSFEVVVGDTLRVRNTVPDEKKFIKYNWFYKDIQGNKLDIPIVDTSSNDYG